VRRQGRRSKPAERKEVSMVNKAKDPVCGMDVNKQGNRKEKYANQEYFFCSDDCRSRFNQNPGFYSGST
jgi:YHS domain-containing protein